MIHQDSLGFSMIPWASPGFAGIRRDSLGFVVFRELTRFPFYADSGFDRFRVPLDLHFGVLACIWEVRGTLGRVRRAGRSKDRLT